MTLLLQTVDTSCLHTKEKVSDILWANAMENINKDANQYKQAVRGLLPHDFPDALKQL